MSTPKLNEFLDRDELLAQADALERGAPIDQDDRYLYVLALRALAEQLDVPEKRPRGQPPRFNHVVVAWGIELALRAGKTREQAIADAADEYGVSDQAIKKATRPFRNAIRRLLET